MNVNINKLKKGVNSARNSVKTAIDFLRTVKASTWIKIGSGFMIGLAGGALLRQPEVNLLTEENKKSQSDRERLQILVQGYHDQFVKMQASVEALKAKGVADEAKREGMDGRAVVMYQYAAKEYIELYLRPRDERGVMVLPEKEYSYFCIFKKVVDGEQLEEEDAVKLQNYIYPKYKKEIEGLVEYEFEDLLKQLAAS